MANEIATLTSHLRLSATLFYRHGLLLTAIWSAGTLFDQILLRLAVEIGFFSRVLGLVAIAPVILLQLVIFVTFFVILRDGAPRRAGRAPSAAGQGLRSGLTGAAPSEFAIALLAVLVPFYGYYAGWGLLGDTLRSYTQIFYNAQMARIDFTNPQPVASALEVSGTGWVVLAVLVIWLIRRGAKQLSARGGGSGWAMLIVGCEATWALLGLYVIGGWKQELTAWLASLPPPSQIMDWFVTRASAAITDPAVRPVDWPAPPEIWPTLKSLFWYALLPLIWFNLGAIVYGHNMYEVRGETNRYAGFVIRRWQALPRPVTDFIGHFWTGVIRRWHAVTNGVLLAASAGFALTASVLVLWRLVDWLGNWAWLGAAQLIGPQDMLTWQVVSVPLNALFNAPGAPPGGLLVSPLQFCILAAGLQLASRSRDGAAMVPAGAEEPA